MNEEKIVLDVIIAEIEKSYILEALQFTKGNERAAARRLNISARSLRYRIQKYNLKGG